MTKPSMLGVAALCLMSVTCGGGKSSPTMPSGPAGATIHIPVGASPLTTTAYVPNPVNVQVGATVTWVNDDSVPHTSTSSSGGWDSGNLPPGGRFNFTFRSAGSFNYLCLVHPNMVGTVNVQ